MDDIDYSLYLVTARDLLPPGKAYLDSLEESLQGGVTVVQIREKHADTAEFIRIAKESKVICDRYNVPLFINDRVDVAIAINARGVHLGQTDMSVAQARSLLPKGAVIGVSCNTEAHVRAAVRDGADYVGIGAIWDTQTKKLTQPIVGVRGIGARLQVLDGTNVKAVAIGGIKSTNALRTLYGSVSPTNRVLDGFAVVSDIVASSVPRVAATKLQSILHAFANSFTNPSPPLHSSIGVSPEKSIIEGVINLMNTIRRLNPLVHQITNNVVATQSANVTLALGASPIMATEPREMEDLSHICSALLVNIGTMRSDTKEGMLKAGYFGNTNKKPVVFDPVGVGASTFRKETVNELLNVWQASVIKGNAGELATLAGSLEVESKGVDSVGSGFKDPCAFVKNLARKERCIIVLTGPVDYVSDGSSVVLLRNGHEILGKITGSGCILGSCIASYCAAAASLSQRHDGQLVSGDMLLGAVAGILVLTIAAEIAVRRDDVKGAGTFLPALIDELWTLTPESMRSMAHVEIQ